MFMIFYPHDEESTYFKIALTEYEAIMEVGKLNSVDNPDNRGEAMDYRYKEIHLDGWNSPEINTYDKFTLTAPMAELLQVDVGTIMKLSTITTKMFTMGSVDGKLCRERLPFLHLPEDLASVTEDTFYQYVQPLFYKGGSKGHPPPPTQSSFFTLVDKLV